MRFTSARPFWLSAFPVHRFVMVVADDHGQPPPSSLVLPQLHELGIALIVIGPRMAEPVHARLQCAVVLHREDLNAHQVAVHFATNVLLDIRYKLLAGHRPTAGLIMIELKA